MCEFQLGTAFVRDRRWVGVGGMVESQVLQHGSDGVRDVNFSHNTEFALHQKSRDKASDFGMLRWQEQRNLCSGKPTFLTDKRFVLGTAGHFASAQFDRLTFGIAFHVHRT